MRRIITGVDADGRSCVVAEDSLEGEPMRVVKIDGDRGMRVHSVCEPSDAIPRQLGTTVFRDVGLDDGQAMWHLVHWGPNLELAPHYTNTLDFDQCLAGSMTIILGDGEHELGPGDCVVINGVDHGWRSGPEGATMLLMLIGSPGPTP